MGTHRWAAGSSFLISSNSKKMYPSITLSYDLSKYLKAYRRHGLRDTRGKYAGLYRLCPACNQSYRWTGSTVGVVHTTPVVGGLFFFFFLTDTHDGITVTGRRSGRNRRRTRTTQQKLQCQKLIILLHTTYLDVRFSMNFSTVISSSKTKSPIPGSSRVAILSADDGRFVFG